MKCLRCLNAYVSRSSVNVKLSAFYVEVSTSLSALTIYPVGKKTSGANQREG